MRVGAASRSRVTQLLNREELVKKLKLDLDLLKIDAFETTVARQRPVRGTVVGQDPTGPSDCETCVPNTYNCDSEFGTCGIVMPDTFPDTCDVQLCNETHAGCSSPEPPGSCDCTTPQWCGGCATYMGATAYCAGCGPSQQGPTSC